MVSLTNIRNTLADILASSGIRNADRYFAPITPEIEMQLLQMQQQQQAALASQQPSDPAQAMVQAEAMKAQTNAQVQMTKAQMENQRKMHEMAMKDDLARDQMAQDLYVDAATLAGQYGQAVDLAKIKAEQDKERMHNESMMRMAGI